MAMNPQNVLSSLRMMSDQQLQQYAAMHKNDPFIFPLAFQESQTRKQMRAGEQAMQQPQGPVVDQALDEMAPAPEMPLPEDVGIGQLPADNLKGMAGGGIVAFDEGGSVPRYQTGGRPGYSGSLMGDIPGFESGSILADAKAKLAAGRPLSSVEKALLFSAAPLAAAGDVLALPFTGAANLVRNPMDTSPRPSLTPFSDARSKALYGDQPAPAAPPPMKMGDNLGATDASLGAAGVAALAAADKGAPGAALVDQGGKTVVASPPARPPVISSTPFKPAEAPTIASAKDIAGQLLDSNSYKAEIEKYQKAEEDAVTAAREARKEGKPAGKAYEEYESMLRKETEDLGKQKDSASAEAWLTAGLAVLGGTSPFALQNLSLAGKGVEQYRDAMKDIRKSTRENAKGLADIAQARRAEERGDWEKSQEFEERASTRMSNARKFGVEGIMSLGVKNAELAGRAYDTMSTQAGMDRRTMAELQSRENIARAQMAAPGAQEHLFSTLGGGDVAKGLGIFSAAMGPEARGDQALLAKYADPIKLMTLKTTNPELYDYVKARLTAQMLPTTTAKPTGPVRD
jgi:hypothetical protein